MNAKEVLDQYSDMVIMLDDLRVQKERLIDSVLTPEIKEKLQEIEAEFAPKFDALEEKKSEFEAEVKSLVAQGGATVRGSTHMAVYSKPRTSWDTKMLEGLMMVIPQIADARKIGNPSVSIRVLK